MKSTIICALVAISHNVLASPRDYQKHVLHERRDSTTTFSKTGSVASNMVIPVRIGLTQKNLDQGPDLLLEVSDPNSPKYGQYYSVEDIHDLFAPTQQTVSAVTGWLDAAGIKNVSESANRQWLQFDATVADAEQLLKTKYHYYENDAKTAYGLGVDEYYLPADIRAHVDYVTPAIKMINLRNVPQAGSTSTSKKGARKSYGAQHVLHSPLPMDIQKISQAEATNNLQYCSAVITPNCIAAMYNITAPSSGPKQNGNVLGIFEDDGQFLDSADLDLFFASVTPQIPNGTFPVFEGIDGATNLDNPDNVGAGEAELDFEIAYPIIYPQNPVIFQTDDDYYSNFYEFDGLFNNFLDGIDGSYCNYTAYGETGNNNTLDPTYPDPNKGGYKGKLQCGVYKPTNVISLSYGLAEIGVDPNNYVKRQCNEYMKLGMQGVSIVFSSGDYGVEEYRCLGPNVTAFSPQFPASCPYVTAVGATVLPAGANVLADAEVAVQDFFSGGGFSNLFAQPNYQKNAVANYFKSPAGPKYPYYTGSTIGNGLYNRSGRGYPDVSAVGDRILTFTAGSSQLSAGTSASAPLFASILTRINEVRLAAGKPTLGFVNPALYQNPQAFHDITSGDNPGCHTSGFSAGTGWDPVTGLGTPNYPALLKAFMGGA